MKKRIKMIFFIGSLGNGGAERTVLNILNNINHDKFEVSLCLLSNNEENSYKSLLTEKVNIILLNSRARYTVFKITKLIKKEKPDIIFSTLSYVNFIVYIANKLSLSKAKVILREANFMKKGYNMSKISYYLVRHAYKNCHRVISLSKGVKTNLIDHFKVEEKKIRCVYNPIDIMTIEKLKNEFGVNVQKDKFTMISCGRLTKQKNHELLINAVKHMNVDKDRWLLNIVGDGEDKEKLQNLVKDMELEENIKFLGFQKNPYKYMKNSDLFILSSLWEGFGHVVAEAMACGTPVLSTDCPHGPKEILDNGQYGWLVPNNDEKALIEKLEFLIMNQSEIEKIKPKINERISYFDSRKIVKEYEKVFLDVLSD